MDGGVYACSLCLIPHCELQGADEQLGQEEMKHPPKKDNKLDSNEQRLFQVWMVVVFLRFVLCLECIVQTDINYLFIVVMGERLNEF